MSRRHGQFLIANGRRLAVLVLFFLLAGCGEKPLPTDGSGVRTGAIDGFLGRHWQRPIGPQGPVPAGFGTAGHALDPEACGACHAGQFSDWKASLHSRAMGPGVLGQLVDMAPEAREEHQACIRCHAPLSEQATSLSEAIADKTAHARPGAHERGLTCAGCHVRQHIRFGPPRRDGSAPLATDTGLPHGGWSASAAFEDSKFCAACHQFGEGDFALNGKYLENTYEEWKASRYAKEGRACQSCHMPDRRHLWRGVHDEPTMRGGVTMRASDPVRAGPAIQASLEVRNTGTGHRFPTYVTPKVIAEIFQSDRAGKMLRGTLRQYVIARVVSADLSTEISDTRLAPDEAATFDYLETIHPNAVSLTYRMRVEPDAFYAGLFESLLAGGPAVRGEKMIRTALAASLRSGFTFNEERRPLPGQEAGIQPRRVTVVGADRQYSQIKGHSPRGKE
ncbi:MAG: hypothetical protein JSS40_05065 [Proteobacteria bacterium]|nr:hypothetical protein [Pseudomonadota bacterium]